MTMLLVVMKDLTELPNVNESGVKAASANSNFRGSQKI